MSKGKTNVKLSTSPRRAGASLHAVIQIRASITDAQREIHWLIVVDHTAIANEIFNKSDVTGDQIIPYRYDPPYGKN